MSAEDGVRASFGTVWALHPCVRGVGMVRQPTSGRIVPVRITWAHWPNWTLGWEFFGSFPRPFVRTLP